MSEKLLAMTLGGLSLKDIIFLRKVSEDSGIQFQGKQHLISRSTLEQLENLLEEAEF